MFWSGQAYNQPRGKNQINLEGPFSFTNIWPFLNILKLAGNATQLILTVPISSITWSGGIATVTTASPHGFYNGSTPQSGWAIQIQNAVPAGYNGSFSNCTITGASTFTFPLAASTANATTPGNAVLNIWSNIAPNLPNSAYGQGNNLNQYFDVNGDVQPNLATLTTIIKNFYLQPTGGVPIPAGYTRAGQQISMDWTGDSNLAGGVLGVGTSTNNSFGPFTWQAGYDTSTIIMVFNLTSSQQRASPPKNIRIYLTANQALINTAGQVFEPAYLSMLKQGAGVIRVMDFMATNDSNVLTYSGFATEAYREWGDPSSIPGTCNLAYGMPISVVTKLVNATNKHPWINIPATMGTAKYAKVSGVTKSGSAGATTIVTTSAPHNFIAGDVVIPFNFLDGGGAGSFGQSAAVTITVGTATVSWPGHAFVNGQNVFFVGGTLPNVTGQSANISNRSFYVTNTNTGAGTFQLAGTRGGSVVSLSGTASGVTGISQFNRNAFTVGSSNLTAYTFEVNCDSSNFGIAPTIGFVTTPFSLSGMTTEITNMISAIKSQLNGQLVPRFEYSNENWNLGTFFQGRWVAAQAHNYVDGSGNPFFPFDDFNQMYGYLSAHVMKTIRDVYGGAGGRALWHGIIATQTGNSGVTPSVALGVNNYLTSSGLLLTDLFNDLAVTGYYGEVFQPNGQHTGQLWNGATISIGANARVKPASGTSNLVSGTPFIFTGSGLPTDAATGNALIVWSASTPPAFSTGIYWATSSDTGSGVTFTSSNNNGVLGPNVTTSGTQSGTVNFQAGYASLVANWMNDSTAHNTIDPATYPTKYTYFNTMVNLEVKDGRFMQSPFNVAQLPSIWASHIVAGFAGLGMVQYEGGNGNYTQFNSEDGTPAFAANGTRMVSDPQTQEFFKFAFGTAEDAANWTGMVAAWQTFGTANSIAVSYPSQFVDATNINYGAILLAVFGANYYVDPVLGVGTGIPGNPKWNAIVGTN